MARRLLITLCLAALGVLAWWILQSREQPDEGLVVTVQVEDAAGTPLPDAQVQAVYTPGWRKVDPAGRCRLTRVVLRADEEPSPEALRAAVQVRARFYTLRRGSEPEVVLLPDGAFEMRFRLEHHGVFRLALDETHLGPVKAFLEPDAKGRWEAMDRGNVARPGAPAAYRIYEGLPQLVIRLEGEPDKDGAIAAATRRWTVDAPGPGFLLERTFEADEVKPILGSVMPPPEGPRPPTLRGIVTIVGLGEDGSRTDYGAVPVDDTGSFIIRRLGAGTYELRARCDCVGGFAPRTVQAGDVVELAGTTVEPWLVVEHAGLFHAKDRNATFALEEPTGRARLARPLLYAGERTTVALPGELALAPGTRLVVRAPGTDTEPPLVGTADVTIEQQGANGVEVELEQAAFGSITVRVAREALEKTGGATVRVGAGRETTLIAKLAETAQFDHVAAGRHEVRIEWNRRAKEAAVRSVDVSADVQAIVEIGADDVGAPGGS